MDPVLMCVVVAATLFAIVAISIYGRTNTQQPYASINLPAKGMSANVGRNEIRISDEEFERIFEKSIAATVDKHFYVKIAGVSHRNKDRTSRTAEIRRCKPFDSLRFVHDENNEFSDHALMVFTEEGRQLGFLPDHTAEEVLRHQRKGQRVAGIFRHCNHHPESGRVVGAVIMVVYIKPESVAARP